MKIESDANEVVNSWRAVIKNKRRMVYTFGERADIRLSAIKGQIYQRRIPLDSWEIRECYHRGADRYEYLGDWRPIVGGGALGRHGRHSFLQEADRDPRRVCRRDGGAALLHRRRLAPVDRRRPIPRHGSVPQRSAPGRCSSGRRAAGHRRGSLRQLAHRRGRQQGVPSGRAGRRGSARVRRLLGFLVRIQSSGDRGA